ncbi:MAG: hypothetical protein IJ008_02190 [Clostridia bacterium]|nr:hypothetical protein [Clostridia bacterium]
MNNKEIKTAIKKIRKHIKENDYPTISPCIKRNDPMLRCNYNCYGYVFGLTGEQYQDINQQGVWNLGFTDQTFGFVERFGNPNVVRYLLKNDFKKLKLKLYESNENEKLNQGEIKFALYSCEQDFHFVRQDADGTWSHKMGWNCVEEKFETENGKLKKYFPRGDKNYELMGIYKSRLKPKTKVKEPKKSEQKFDIRVKRPALEIGK